LEKTKDYVDHFQQASDGAGAGSCDFCRVIELCRTRNLTIAFTGDSMQNQIWSGFLCEGHRRNYNIQKSTAPTNVTKRRGGKFHRTELYHFATITSPHWPEGNYVRVIFFPIYRLPFSDPNERDLLLTLADVIIMGFGLHYRWLEPDNYKTSKAAYFKAVKGFLEIATPRVPLLIQRETTAQHFVAPEGDYGLRDV
jgi:hypothetical protein